MNIKVLKDYSKSNIMAHISKEKAFYLLEHWNDVRLAREDGKHVPENGESFFAGTDHIYVIIKNGTAYIYCDGSDHLIEWIEDFDCDRNGDLFDSEGFDSSSVVFYDQLKYLSVLVYRVVAIGHSRGGPIAIGIAERFKKAGIHSEVISFGSPKQGGHEFVEAMKALEIPHTRVEMKRDIVCQVPINFTKEWEHYETDHVLIDHDLHGIKHIHLGYGTALENLCQKE